MESARILIVDDDAMLAEQLRGILGLLGHFPVCCQDAAKALSLVDEEPFDLVFCDYWMPGASGQEFYHQVRQKRPDLASRIVFLTAGVLGEETQFFLQSTGALQLLKPFKLAAVKQVMAAAFADCPSAEAPAAADP